jgi:hypothetical protein
MKENDGTLAAAAAPTPAYDKEQLMKIIMPLIREAEERMRNEPRPPRAPPTIHYTKLTPLPAGTELACESNFYCRIVGHLLAEGHEGKFVLIKGENIIGFYDTFDAACDAGRAAYPRQSIYVHQILTEEPLLLQY